MRNRARLSAIAVAAPSAGFLLFLVLPIAALGLKLDLGRLGGALLDPVVREAALVSFGAATVTLIVCTGFGLPLAYLLARHDFRGKSIVEVFTLLPVFVPPLVAGVLLLMAYGLGSPVGQGLDAAGIRLGDAFWGIVIAQTFVACPYVIHSSRASIQAVDRRLEDVSRTLGRSAWQTFRRVTFPLARRGIFVGMVLTWARAVAEFGATVVFAFHPHSLPVRIWINFSSGGLAAALPVAAWLLLVSLALLAAVRLFASGRFAEASAGAPR